MAQWDEKSVAAELLACEAERRDREPFTDDWPELDVDTAYRIQDANLEKRLARGETALGVKLGLTSEAKQRRMGVYAPFVAWLTDDMVMHLGDPVPQDKLIHPRIEPEIVFVMKDRLEGPGVTRESAMAAVGSIALSALLRVFGKKDAAIFVGQWPPTFILFALAYKVLRPSNEDVMGDGHEAVRHAPDLIGANR